MLLICLMGAAVLYFAYERSVLRMLVAQYQVEVADLRNRILARDARIQFLMRRNSMKVADLEEETQV